MAKPVMTVVVSYYRLTVNAGGGFFDTVLMLATK